MDHEQLLFPCQFHRHAGNARLEVIGAEEGWRKNDKDVPNHTWLCCQFPFRHTSSRLLERSVTANPSPCATFILLLMFVILFSLQWNRRPGVVLPTLAQFIVAVRSHDHSMPYKAKQTLFYPVFNLLSSLFNI